MANTNHDHHPNENDADDKSHTFRKRRLSLTRHHESNSTAESSSSPSSPLNGEISVAVDKNGGDTSAASGDVADAALGSEVPVVQLAPRIASAKATFSAAAAAAAVAAEFESESETEGASPLPKITSKEPTTPQPADGLKNGTENSTATAASGAVSDGGAPPSDDGKAQTFRKRRLSLTHRSDDEDSLSTQGQNQLGTHAKRRASELSAASSCSINSAPTTAVPVLRSRTVHAGELLASQSNNWKPPPSPAVQSAQHHILYRTPFRPLTVPFGASAVPTQHQPKWKRRHTRHFDEDERKLPFPRDIVGTFSCHGVEPIYESDYEEHIDSDLEDDLWEADESEAPTNATKVPPQPPLTTEADSNAAGESPSDMKIPSKTAPQATDPNINEKATEPKPTTAAKINQDRGGVAFPYGNCPRTALFAAYDGHGLGGELVSQFALHEVQSRLEKHPDFSTNLEKAFIDTFLEVDEALKHEPQIEPLYAGTTACVALLRDTTITVANAGDSRAVIARRRNTNGEEDEKLWDALDVTIDQNPDMPGEKERVESMGGFVSPPPEPGLSARVWLDAGFTQIGLAMSRSLGDHAVAKVGVIAEPVVSRHEITPEDEFMIIASDGVWEFLSSEEAVTIVGENLSRGATKACQALIEASAAQWHNEEGDYRDDITALVIRLQELWRDTNSTAKSTADAKEYEPPKVTTK